MTPYLLFIDTETSGKPNNWKKSHVTPDKWPFIVQIAWCIYDCKGNMIKKENFFINEADINISEESEKIHGISKAKLETIGNNRKDVLSILSADLLEYKPMIIGHFIEFDLRMLKVAFERIKMENLSENLPSYCTMSGIRHFDEIQKTYRHLRLGELYEKLFYKKLENQHDAFVDAEATASCFFKMIENGLITEEDLCHPKHSLLKRVIGKIQSAFNN